MIPILNEQYLRTMSLEELRDALTHRLRLARGGVADSRGAQEYAAHHTTVAQAVQAEIARREALEGSPITEASTDNLEEKEL